MTKSDPKRPGIYWLASYPKSGNTWVRAFLSNLLFERSDINNMMGVTSDISPTMYQAVSTRPLADLSPGEEYLYRPAALATVLETCNWSPCIVKTHFARLTIDDMPMIPPKISAGAVYLVRDPRDVCVSMARHFDVDLEEASTMLCKQEFSINGDGLSQIVTNWSTNVSSWTHGSRFPVMVVRYEDLIDEPIEWFQKITDFLHLSGDVEGAVRKASFNRLQAQEDESGFRERRNDHAFFGCGTYGGWRDTLPEEIAVKIEETHSEVMEKHGYPLAAASRYYDSSRRVAAG